MKLTVFHAADGDCLLLVLGDNPPRRHPRRRRPQASYQKNTRKVLGQRCATANEKLDVVCVSHIDDDHITGILRLVEDEVEWRAFEFRRPTLRGDTADGRPAP